MNDFGLKVNDKDSPACVLYPKSRIVVLFVSLHTSHIFHFILFVQKKDVNGPVEGVPISHAYFTCIISSEERCE